MFIPHTVTGDIMQFIIFIVSIGVIFLFCPSIVGKRYKQEVHSKVIYIIQKYLFKK